MTDRELMQWALDALDGYARNCKCEGGGGTTDAAEALRARLAGWERVNMYDHKEGDLSIGTKPYAAQAAMVAQQTQGRMYVEPVTGDVGIGTVEWDASSPLVVHPHPAFQTTEPQREWQGLTENEKEILWDEAVDGREHFCSQYGNFADAIEAKLKEKNT